MKLKIKFDNGTEELVKLNKTDREWVESYLLDMFHLASGLAKSQEDIVDVEVIR